MFHVRFVNRLNRLEVELVLDGKLVRSTSYRNDLWDLAWMRAEHLCQAFRCAWSFIEL